MLKVKYTHNISKIHKFIGGAIGGYLGKTFNKEVRCIGTSIIGSYLAVFGVSIYVGNFPTQLTLQYGLA